MTSLEAQGPQRSTGTDALKKWLIDFQPGLERTLRKGKKILTQLMSVDYHSSVRNVIALLLIAIGWSLLLSQPGENPFIDMRPENMLEMTFISLAVLAPFAMSAGFSEWFLSINLVYNIVFFAACLIPVLFWLVPQPGLPLAYLSIFLFSINTGILASGVQDSKWLASVLYMRHVNSGLQAEGVKYLHWDINGNRSLYEPSDLTVRWHNRSQNVMCYLEGEVIPLSHCIPVVVTGTSISSAQHVITPLLDEMNPAWYRIVQDFRDALIHGYHRISWLIFLTISIPNNPNALLDDGGKVPTGAARARIAKETYFFRWTNPVIGWEAFRGSLSPGVTHMWEEGQALGKPAHSKPEVFPSSIQNLKQCTRQAYVALMMVTYDRQVTADRQTSLYCRMCVRSLSAWFRSFSRDPLLINLSSMSGFKSGACYTQVPSWDAWQTQFRSILENPTEMYFLAHDQLTNHYNDNRRMNSPLMTIIEQELSQVSAKLMKANRPTKSSVGSLEGVLMLDRKGLATERMALLGVCALRLSFLNFIIECGAVKA